ncbi:MAG: hypothetical protein AAFR61_11455 [Bacteroidota bacterium]
MENTTQDAQAAANQVYEYAANLLVNEGKSPFEVRKALVEQGLDEESAKVVVDNLEAQVQDAKRERGQKDMLYGALWCIGGTVATVANIGYIFWGAILFGAFQFIQGAIRYFS